MKRIWIKEAEYYADFLNLEKPTIKTTKQAKEYLKELLEFIIATNGEGTLYEWEIELSKDLDIELNN